MQSKWLWGLLILFIGVIAFCFLFLMEQYTTEEWIGPSAEAHRNPFLAATRYLESRNVEVIKTTDKLDFSNIGTEQTVLLTEVDQMLVSKTQVDEAMNWIYQGGYMIVGVANEIQGHVSLLSNFDIEPDYLEIEIEDAFLNDDGTHKSASQQLRELNRKIEQEQSQAQEESADTPTQNEKPIDSDDELSEQFLDLINDDYSYEYFKLDLIDEQSAYIALLDRIVLNHPNFDSESDADPATAYELSAWGFDDNGARLLQFDYGEGTLLVLSSSELWENRYIGLGDHAFLLSYFVPDNNTLQLFYDLRSKSLMSLLYSYFKEAVLSALVLLGLWIWARGIRIQKIRQPLPTGSRNFAEHLRSGAEFLVNQKQFSPLLEAVIIDIEKSISPRHPHFSNANEKTKAAILAEVTELPISTINKWLTLSKNINSREQLQSALELGNAIRKRL